MLKELTENEKKLLSIISRLVFTNRRANADRITYIMGIKIPDLINNWKQPLQSLIEKRILKCEKTATGDITYQITEYGRSFAQYIASNNFLDLYFYNEFYEKAEKSEVHSEFCKLVYGKDLCQHGMLDMNQLDKLIEISKLNSNSNVLELGCGNGFITEYISDKTQCHITGIDIAKKAIEHANERTKQKNNRIIFETKNMEKLDYKEKSFDVIISIDTLYFVKDLNNTLQNIQRLLKQEGVMYIFYHVPPDAACCSELNPSKDSMLGKALDRLNCKYQTIDFTKENKRHWELKKQVLLKLKSNFEGEGSMFLYNNRMAECMGNLGEFYRFLYIITLE